MLLGSWLSVGATGHVAEQPGWGAVGVLWGCCAWVLLGIDTDAAAAAGCVQKAARALSVCPLPPKVRPVRVRLAGGLGLGWQLGQGLRAGSTFPA